MAAGRVPTFRSFVLRIALRKLREELGLSQEQAAAATEGEVVPPTISRWESGDRLPGPGAVRMLLDAYGITGRRRDALIKLAREARAKSVWTPYSDVLPSWFVLYLELEGASTLIRAYESEAIPGLLQTREYASAQMHADPERPSDDAELARLLDARMDRQTRLQGAEPPDLWIVLSPGAVLRGPSDTRIHQAQLEHLLAVGARPTVTIQVLPFGKGMNPAHCPFYLFTLPEPESIEVGYVEYRGGSLYLEAPNELYSANVVFRDLAVRALAPDESADFISDVAAKLG
jgi:transcriptional regulator with XRE-family HTH domain